LNDQSKASPTIEELLDGISDENLHEAQITGFVGLEVWEWAPEHPEILR
jgi:hypothetical protein